MDEVFDRLLDTVMARARKTMLRRTGDRSSASSPLARRLSPSASSPRRRSAARAGSGGSIGGTRTGGRMGGSQFSRLREPATRQAPITAAAAAPAAAAGAAATVASGQHSGALPAVASANPSVTHVHHHHGPAVSLMPTPSLFPSIGLFGGFHHPFGWSPFSPFGFGHVSHPYVDRGFDTTRAVVTVVGVVATGVVLWHVLGS